jgi:2-succinyl-5-enolpyruvyl-6-hydroxy-3-cyclohexene-1-carboxylate synthase
MIKQLTSKKNLNEAYLQVYSNKGAAGIDAIGVTELKSILKVQGKQYIQ